jgi:hypothetical protein
MSMPKPVCPNMATATLSALWGPQTPQKQHAGLLELDAQPSAASSRPPSERGAEGLCLGMAGSHSVNTHIPDTYAASGSEASLSDVLQVTFAPRSGHAPIGAGRCVAPQDGGLASGRGASTPVIAWSAGSAVDTGRAPGRP